MLNWIYTRLLLIRNKKEHEILRLKWEQASLQKNLDQIKAEQYGAMDQQRR